MPSETAGDTITNLYDAFGGTASSLTQDWGFAALVRYRGHTILFDTGSRGAVLDANARRLGIDLGQVEVAVISHAHSDHTGGLEYLLSVNPHVRLFLPDDAALGAPVEFALPDSVDESAALPLPIRQRYFDGMRHEVVNHPDARLGPARVEYVSESRSIGEGIWLVATESPLLGTFARAAPDAEPRLFGLPELSLVLAEPRGDVVVVGCSHSTVRAIVQAVEQVRKRNVDLIVGGFHLLTATREVAHSVAEHLRDDAGVRRVAPAHCTGAVGFQQFAEVFQQNYLFAGLGAVLDVSSDRE